MSTDITLNKIILSYPHLVTMWSGKPTIEPSYNCAFILPQDFAQWAELQACVEEAKTAKFGASPPVNLKLPWLNQFLQPKVLTDGPYSGCYTLSATGKDRKPRLYDAEVNEVSDLVAKQIFFAGAIVNAYVNFYGYTGANAGVGTGLRMIQLVDNQNVIRLGDEGKEAGEVFQTIPGAPPATAPVGAPPGAVPGAGVPAAGGGSPWD